ncbi:unnamed protein product [Strongylus vulgaris]|uniref:ShKT domain-containing protein n=1 Tax=Strongylus vulgaris TaxID=40348 RepID=A0A3P7JD56_STRVU|nr:unnamed protein product [Strongylus vulgaris]
MFLYTSILYSALFVLQINAQSCEPDGGTGLCINNQCSPGSTCIIDTQECCDDNRVISPTTVPSTDTTVTSVNTLASGATTVSSPAECCDDNSVIPPTTVPNTDATVASQNEAKNCAIADATTVSSPAVTVSSATGATTATTCVDLLNPRTGVSDCPSRISLCNDPVYYDVMTEQCPKTCGRCSGSSTGGTTTCVDKLNPATGTSDCPALSHLCNNAAYLTLMTEQCPLTCNRCSTSGGATTAASGTCVDKVNPRTGTSDCPMRVSLCQDSTYNALMRVECPKTCGFCSSSSSVTSANTVASTATVSTATATATARAPGTCVDAINPRTGVSDCPQRVSLCNDTVYRDLMSAQCPLTCGLC